MIIIITAFIRAVFFLDHFHKSIHEDMMFSNTAITVEKAAKAMKMKKQLPQIRPPGIFAKIFGKVTKISFGPWSGLTPNAKHVGKIINPDTTATNVS